RPMARSCAAPLRSLAIVQCSILPFRSQAALLSTARASPRHADAGRTHDAARLDLEDGARVLPALALDEADDHQQHHGADHAINDHTDEAGERHEAQLRQEPRAEERADDADDDVPEQAEAEPAHDLPGQPAGNRAGHQTTDDAQTLHNVLPLHAKGRSRSATNLPSAESLAGMCNDVS